MTWINDIGLCHQVKIYPVEVSLEQVKMTQASLSFGPRWVEFDCFKFRFVKGLTLDWKAIVLIERFVCLTS